MRILGIETSCDETAAAVVQDGERILSHSVLSSLKEHSKFGGIIPEIASRRQLECIEPIVTNALGKARCSLKDIDQIAVTTHPGLSGSLLVGTSFAKALSYATQKPLIGVNHIQAHLYANCLYEGEKPKLLPKLPAIGMVVSGGHTSLFHIKKWNKLKLIGQTRDDAAGEAFDKVARILQLGYPGGPAIEKLSGTISDTDLKFMCAPLKGTFDFSFSGIKTAVLYHTRKLQKLTRKDKAAISRSFQNSVVEILVQKAVHASQEFKCKTILLGGGVAANQYLRQQLQEAAHLNGIQVFFPPIKYCLDNAAMIAGLAFHYKSPSQRSVQFA